jgi:hypothetical protein
MIAFLALFIFSDVALSGVRKATAACGIEQQNIIWVNKK